MDTNYCSQNFDGDYYCGYLVEAVLRRVAQPDFRGQPVSAKRQEVKADKITIDGRFDFSPQPHRRHTERQTVYLL